MVRHGFEQPSKAEMLRVDSGRKAGGKRRTATAEEARLFLLLPTPLPRVSLISTKLCFIIRVVEEEVEAEAVAAEHVVVFPTAISSPTYLVD